MTFNKKSIVVFALLSCRMLLAQPVTVPALGPRFKQTRERVDALFQYRGGNYPPPDPQINLFRPLVETSPSPVISPREMPPANQPADLDETVLSQALAALKKGGGGLVALAGRTHLTFNQKLYKEGDYISVALRDKRVSIHILRISANSVTLALNGSVAVWYF